MNDDFIKIRGARQHNLKNIDIDLPKNKLIVFTGVSGSGKSSLAFDTLYAEGQRRYVESLSSYARQFLGIMEKPDVDLIEGLSPAISIEQKSVSKNPRSTVGTVTEIYDYLRLLFSRIGHPHCPICKREIFSQTPQQIVEEILKLIKEKTKIKKVFKFLILSPVVIDRKGEFRDLFLNLKAKGYTKVRVDGQIRKTDEDLILIKTNRHNIEVVIDTFSLDRKNVNDLVFLSNLKTRIFDSVEQSLNLSQGLVIVSEILDSGFFIPEYPNNFEDHLYSERFACPIDNVQIPEIEPRTFSFNSPHGACPTCNGLGKIKKINPDRIFSPQISIKEGGIIPFASLFERNTWFARIVLKVCEENDIDPYIPIGKIPKEKVSLLLYGTGERVYKVTGLNKEGYQTTIYETFPGLISELERRYLQSTSEYIKAEIEKYMRETLCPTCNGSRLKKEALGITIDKKSIAEVCSMSIKEVKRWVENLIDDENILSPREREISKLILKELKSRLDFLIAVGLDYVTIDRSAETLSGGESQRIRLASQIGSGLTGVLYVLDEPTIGLHPRDTNRLIATLRKLRDLKNTVVVVEHDRETIKSADYIVEFGPGAGKNGGYIISQGTLKDVLQNEKSVTAPYIMGKKKIEVHPSKKANSGILKLYGLKKHNLKNIDISFPLGKLVVVTGVSGSGKSTLLVDTLYPALKRHLDPYSNIEPPELEKIEGVEKIDKVILIDQSPIGRTPRSNPATYVKVFDFIREVFASTKEARALGFKKSRFSFNLKGGRCEACEGQGQTKIEMVFLSDIWITCEVCKGKRYNSQTLEIEYKGKNIADVLEMTVSEAKEFFSFHRQITSKLQTLIDVGLDYMILGQPATTLSGGEAQRVKLAAELSKKDTGNTVYILDEPTTGLHFKDLEKLLRVLRLLVDRGNSVFVIEHNPDVIKNADWIIDLGPEGGEKGGQIVAQGTIKEIKKCKESFTAKYI